MSFTPLPFLLLNYMLIGIYKSICFHILPFLPPEQLWVCIHSIREGGGKVSDQTLKINQQQQRKHPDDQSNCQKIIFSEYDRFLCWNSTQCSCKTGICKVKTKAEGFHILKSVKWKAKLSYFIFWTADTREMHSINLLLCSRERLDSLLRNRKFMQNLVRWPIWTKCLEYLFKHLFIHSKYCDHLKCSQKW